MDENKTVHLADDDEDDRMLLREAFEEANPGVNVVESENGRELIDNIKNSDDLSDTVVVMDMNMPQMNGLEAIEAMKSDPELAEIPTVMLSTSDNPELAKKALEAGADEFITKPNNFRALIDIAKRIFGKFFA
ncbi:Response regulator receiver domain-containing protein [Dyadobacter koreensis]|uniref:Response regulator receiver domain-containing protein n=1 Tax=Dyadobacter koreensis TaxID=408657 RepID=A0A1H6QK02_9BACT|nr:response regulator [Dyadobacter koreensis]SEI42276.1 Response regulator receiver domain-containing protein [Dyadobacter koreensis]